MTQVMRDTPPDLDGILRYIQGLKVRKDGRINRSTFDTQRLLRCARWLHAEAEAHRDLPGVDLTHYITLRDEFIRLSRERWDDGRLRRFSRAREALEAAAIELALQVSARRV